MIYRDNYDYFSKKLVCFKGGGSDSVDEVYNAGMLDLSEHQQGMADEMFAFYKGGKGGAWEETQVETKAASTGFNKVWSGGGGRDGVGHYNNVAYDIPAEYETQRTWVPDGTTSGYMDMEQAQIDANMELIPLETEGKKSDLELSQAITDSSLSLLPGQTDLSAAQTASDRRLVSHEEYNAISNFGLNNAQNQAARKLLPGQTALAGKLIADQSTAIDERAPVRQAFYEEAANGVNAEERADRAAADAAHAFVNSNSISRRDSARMGVNPNSGRFKAMQTSNSMDRAKAIGGARTQARTQANNDNFDRLNTAMSYGG